jgi:radical SAM protein (TIGR01212 family)
MENPFRYSNTNKRYHTFTYFLEQKFGRKVAKISLDAGFTCPNIDGSKGVGGCTYCSARGSGDFAGDQSLSLREQFEQVRKVMDQKWPDAVYIPYFQAHTNTYAPLAVLKEKFEEALSFPNVVGLAIATRADCITDEIADYLGELAQRTYLEVELGLQSVHDVTGERINRCHSYADFLEGYQKLADRGIQICVHIIDGLPGEDREMMLETARRLSRLQLHSIKIHLLHVLKGTVMERQLAEGQFRLLTREEYVGIVCDQLELLPPQMVIQRVTGDGERESLVGPEWSLKKLCVMNEIDKELVRRNSFQGKNFPDEKNPAS